MASRRMALAAIAAAAVMAVVAGSVFADGDDARARQYGGHHDGRGHPGMMMGHGHGMASGMMTDTRRRSLGGMGLGMGLGGGLGMGLGGGLGGSLGGGPDGGAREKADVDDVRTLLERHLARHGNARLKVGDVKETGKDSIVAEIVTAKEGAVVERFAFDRNTGFMRRVN